jgi:hypothetical protein
MPTSIESMPTLSITTREQSLLKPAHLSYKSALMVDTDPEVMVLADTTSNNVYPSFWVPSGSGLLSW